MGVHYSCYFLSAERRVISVIVIQCETDKEAKHKAAELLIDTDAYHGVEVWQAARCVDALVTRPRLVYPKAPGAAPEARARLQARAAPIDSP
jgi:hypothetical protein